MTSRLKINLLSIILGHFFLANGALADAREKSQEFKTTAKWVKEKSSKIVRFPLDKHLNEKQLELINSGFSTFSQLVVYEKTGKAVKPSPIFEGETF